MEKEEKEEEKKEDTVYLNSKIKALIPDLIPYAEIDIISYPIALILIDNLL